MTIFRTFDICMVALMICAAAITYKVKYDAQKRIGDIKRIERQITAEKNMVHLLNTEWALVTQPSRLQILEERYQTQLGLEITKPQQIVDFKDIPERLPDQIENIIKDNELEEINDILASEKNNIPAPNAIDALITASTQNDTISHTNRQNNRVSMNEGKAP